jgi:hypothetical protein
MNIGCDHFLVVTKLADADAALDVISQSVAEYLDNLTGTSNHELLP